MIIIASSVFNQPSDCKECSVTVGLIHGVVAAELQQVEAVTPPAQTLKVGRLPPLECPLQPPGAVEVSFQAISDSVWDLLQIVHQTFLLLKELIARLELLSNLCQI